MLGKIKKLMKNFRCFPRDLIKLIYHRNNIHYDHLLVYLKYRYFKEEWKGNKLDSMLYFNIVNYYLYKTQYMVKELKSFWKKYRFYDETIEIIKKEFETQSELTILDIGCGLTTVLNIIPFGAV